MKISNANRGVHKKELVGIERLRSELPHDWYSPISTLNSIILPADGDRGDWRVEARTQLEPDGTIGLVLDREWRGDGVEPDDFSERVGNPEPYHH